MALCILSSLFAVACTAPNGEGQGGGNQGVEITSVVFSDLTVDYDGEFHTILASGAPSGTSVTYTGAGPFVNAGEYSIAGYRLNTEVEFTYYISLILENDEEVAIFGDIQITHLDGVRAYAFSKTAVEEWALANGYDNYEIRFSFVPIGSDGSFDYAITFAESNYDVTGLVTSNVSFVDYVAEGELKSYTITPTEDGVWTFTSFAQNDTYCYLYDEQGNLLASDDDGSNYYNNFKLSYYLEAGKTYTITVKWWDSERAGNMPLLFGTEPVLE